MISLLSILNDRISGSSELLHKLNQYFIQEIKDKNDFNPDIELIEKKLEPFTNITNYLFRVKEYIQDKDLIGLQNYLNHFDNREKDLLDKLFLECTSVLPRFTTVLTISNSKTLLHFFTYWNSNINEIEIFVCESRPGSEGIIMTNHLSANGLNAKIIKDNEAVIFVEKSEIVLMGADKILNDGSIVNKIGSRNISAMAKNRDIPVFILATKNKLETVKAREILFDKELFEIVDADLITKIITD